MLDAVKDLSDIRQRLESAGIDNESIINLFSQAYVVIGMRYEVTPQDLIQMLTLNGLGLGILREHPDLDPDALAEAVEREVNGEPEDEPLFDRSSPDPDLPLFLVPGLGES